MFRFVLLGLATSAHARWNGRGVELAARDTTPASSSTLPAETSYTTFTTICTENGMSKVEAPWISFGTNTSGQELP